MEEIKYTDTWCDNITPCPYLENVWVNDYDCGHCPHNKGRKDEDNSIDEFTKSHSPADSDYYALYSMANTGIVLCDFK